MKTAASKIYLGLVLQLTIFALAGCTKSGSSSSSNSSATAQQDSSTIAGLFDQKLNHFAAPADTDAATTFKQRYWLNSKYATGPNSPVLLYICGESACGPEMVENGATAEHAAQLQAYVVTLEHRYYGESQPFSFLITPNMVYLTVENAIEDLAIFQRWISQQQNLTGKWIALGGSYSGNLSAGGVSYHMHGLDVV